MKNVQREDMDVGAVLMAIMTELDVMGAAVAVAESDDGSPASMLLLGVALERLLDAIDDGPWLLDHARAVEGMAWLKKYLDADQRPACEALVETARTALSNTLADFAEGMPQYPAEPPGALPELLARVTGQPPGIAHRRDAKRLARLLRSFAEQLQWHAALENWTDR